MAEQFANNCSTTVAAGGYASGSGVLNVASTASPWPATGTFRVSVFDLTTKNLKVILKVTAVNSGTQWAVTAEGTDANAAVGDLVEGTMVTADVMAGLSTPLDTPHSVDGLMCWLSADELSGLNDGDYVLSWPNLATPNSGQVISAQATSTSNYPVYKTNILNSKPIVRFAGAGWFRAILPIHEPQCSIFWVMKISSLANAYTGIVGAGWGTDLGGYFVKSNGKTALYVSASVYDGTASATLNNSTYYVMSAIIGPVLVNTRVALAADATNVAFNNTNITWTDHVLIGNQAGSGTRTFTGDLAEMLMYRRALSTTDRDTIENYLKTKYGL